MLDYSDDQRYALDQIRGWLAEPTSQELTLGGYAGTGKTTLIHSVVQHRNRVRVCAYTGKAAHVLCTKGVSATTIHRLIYVPIVVCTKTDRAAVDCNCAPRCKKTTVEFQLAHELDASLVIVDEASMVNRALYEDLVSFGVKILWVGDHGQLEPIGKNPRLMVDPQLRLETIHRQAEGSAIIQFAHHVRRGNLPKTHGDDARVIESSVVPDDIASYDVVLCGKNSTRVAVNSRIRRERGFDIGELPSSGERVICLRNEASKGLFNGMLATVVEVVVDRDGDGVMMTVEDDMGEIYDKLPIAPHQFGAEKKLDPAPRSKTLWDFGYCLTVHKSQGSEFKRVCVLEWIHPDWSAERWRYTAATRASEQLVYCLNPRRR